MTKKKDHPLKDWRIVQGLSQEDIAKECSKTLKRKVHSSVISNVEKGIEPMLTLAVAIEGCTEEACGLYGVDIYDLARAVIPVAKRKRK